MNKKIFLASLLIGGMALGGSAQSVAPSLSEPAMPSQADLNNSNKKIKQLRQQKNTLIWGHGAATGAVLGEFQNNFVQGGPATSTAWAAVSINESNGSVTPGNAYWTRSTLGYSQGAYWGGTTPVTSTTQSNGVAIFDSDFLDNGGVAGAFGAGTSPGNHKGELISPTIDLTGYTDVPLAVNFFVFYRDFNITEFSVGLSTDGGTTWTNKPIASLITPMTQGNVSALFPNVTTGVTNLTNCRIKFTFDGYYYFYILDDVSISTAEPYDLKIQKANPTSGVTSGDYESMIIGGNVFSLANQINPFDQRIGANVKNGGSQTVLPTDNATLNTTIQRNVGGNWSTVHSQVINIDTVNGGNDDGKAFFANLSNTSWMTVGDYRVIYATSLAQDNNASNDSLIQSFAITDDYLSKVELSTQGDPFFTRSVFPGGTNFNRIEFGSIFSSPNGGSDQLTMESVDCIVRTPANYTGATTQILNSYVYEWIDGSGTGALDGFINNRSELSLVGSGSDTLGGLVPGTYYSSLMDLNSTVSSGDVVMLNGKNYLVTISIEGNQFTSATNLWFGASENRRSYAMNSINSSASNLFLTPSQLFIEDGAGVENSFSNGFGTDMQPSFGVNIGNACSDPLRASILLTNNPTTPTANDGSLDFRASGGTPPYTYLWSNSATTTTNSSLGTGTYSITVTDANNCTASDTITIGGPDCPLSILPTNVAANYITSTTAQIEWDGISGTNVYYLVRYKESGLPNWQTFITTTADSLQVTGLTPNTSYLFIVRTNCNGSWSGQAFNYFRTLSTDCALPTNIGEQWVLSDQVKLTWTSNANASKYIIRYRDSASMGWNRVDVNGVFDFYWLRGLSPLTTYTWQISSGCRFDDASATRWSAARSFTTPRGAQSQPFSMRMKADEIEAVAEASIYPNPSNGLFKVELPYNESVNTTLEVLDISGRTVFQSKVENKQAFSLDLSSLGSGVYFLRILEQPEKLHKLVIQ